MRRFHLAGGSSTPCRTAGAAAAGPVTFAEVDAWFTSLMAGTPSADVVGSNEISQVGYAAPLSPGQSMWHENDLEPGTDITMSFIADPETGMSAVLNGMVGYVTVT